MEHKLPAVKYDPTEILMYRWNGTCSCQLWVASYPTKGAVLRTHARHVKEEKAAERKKKK